ncbi:hypothetical protein J7T55_014825 [Diaporthe amygdali]|uniref:uncharacterized protein n=1 Tax=Phomopsis amygdali TaxID=1214568 RepID=UPI0022FDDE49|nr:uncharacterized protein J7T55_014825 [Diaporthe amygdali]KAJ0110022.1 hypothetical protein J7T55_014825 [Diaporthe amygdali]
MVAFGNLALVATTLGLCLAQSPATISFNPVYDSDFAVANTACGGAEGPNPFSTLAASKGWTTLSQIQANLVASPLAVNRTECGQCYRITVNDNSINALVADAAQSVWVLGQSPEWATISAGSLAGQLAGTVQQVAQSNCVA